MIQYPSQSRTSAFPQVLLAAACALITGTALAADHPGSLPTPAVEDAKQLARRIDELVESQWKEAGITPAPPAGDAEFLRRAALDICGKIPTASQVRDFLEDDAPEKKSQLVERLLASPGYVIHYTNLWRAAMIPEAESSAEIRFALPGFEAWLRSRIAENRNFAEIVAEMLTLPVDPGELTAFSQPERPSPAAFYMAKEGKPERLAAATSRLFLGVRIDCAQCHDHPFDRWKREQFWQHAAFFTDFQTPAASPDESPAPPNPPGTILIPDSDRRVTAAYLDGKPIDATASVHGRSELSRWIIDSQNPWFARAAVNRIWSYHFGLGLVEPMDDFSLGNPASHPELLETLAQAFIEHHYDFKFLIRAITATRVYQLSSRQTDPSQASSRLLGRMPVRGLSAEQIFDSLAVATGYHQPFDPEQPLNFNNDSARQEFIATFANGAESATERSSTILQALSLMNGRFIADATDLTDSRTLAAILDAPFLDPSGKIEALYLTTLSRPPTAAEREHLLKYVDRMQDSAAALADLFWALLNSNEFLLNH